MCNIFINFFCIFLNFRVYKYVHIQQYFLHKNLDMNHNTYIRFIKSGGKDMHIYYIHPRDSLLYFSVSVTTTEK
jgi:hypothetical protein